MERKNKLFNGFCRTSTGQNSSKFVVESLNPKHVEGQSIQKVNNESFLLALHLAFSIVLLWVTSETIINRLIKVITIATA